MPISEIAYWNADYLTNAKKSVSFFPGGISRRMVRSPPGTFPLTDFIGREPEYDDGKFVAAPVQKGVTLSSFLKITQFKLMLTIWGVQIQSLAQRDFHIY